MQLMRLTPPLNDMTRPISSFTRIWVVAVLACAFVMAAFGCALGAESAGGSVPSVDDLAAVRTQVSERESDIPPWRTHGLVADKDGRPVEGAEIIVSRLTSSHFEDIEATWIRLGRATTDTLGRFVLNLAGAEHPCAPSLFAPLVGVRVRADGFVTEDMYEWSDVALEPADVEFRVELERHDFDMICRVVDGAGVPVEGAELDFSVPDGEDADIGSVDGLGEGRYGVDLDEVRQFGLRASHPSHGWSRPVELRAPVEGEPTLVLDQDGHRLEGRVA